MRFFIDSADIEEIRTAYSWGIVDGVMAGRSQAAGEVCDLKCRLGDICQVVDGPVSVEVTATESGEMIEEAHEIASWHPNAIIRLPMTQEGIKAVRKLSEDGIRTNVTLVFSLAQALVAAKVGATFISIPVNRQLDDTASGGHGMDVVRDTVGMIETYDFGSEVIVTDVSDVGQVVDAASAGAHAAAIPFKIMEQLLRRPLTDSAIERQEGMVNG